MPDLDEPTRNLILNMAAMFDQQAYPKFTDYGVKFDDPNNDANLRLIIKCVAAYFSVTEDELLPEAIHPSYDPSRDVETEEHA